MDIRFCGATTAVTGSCHLISTSDGKNILLDCGMFQGNKTMEKLNYEPFDFEPSDVECVIISHAHIDHTGRLPLLVRRGFSGIIYCTDATADLLKVMLKDSAHIQEKEAEWQNRKNQRAGKPLVEPLYTQADADAALKLVRPVLYDQLVELCPGVQAVFNDAGHILGSAIVELFIEEGGKTSKLVYSGDLGVPDRPILRDAKKIKKADYLIMETTYGNRLHGSNEVSIDQLLQIVLKTIKRGGNVIIPSFAVGRTQELIFEFNRFYEEHPDAQRELEDVMIYVDSPMATTATEVFRNNAQVFDEETREYILRGDNPLDFKNLRFTRTADDSKQLNMDPSPKVIISASGMCEAGRIKHHLKHNLWNPKASIVFVGYQAEGTLGRSIVQGSQEVSLFGEKIHVGAEVYNLEGFSGHADRDGLLDWLGGFEKAPKHIFLVHGELDAKRDFAAAVKERYGYDCTVLEGNCSCTLSPVEETAVPASLGVAAAVMTPEKTAEIRARISQVHENLDGILFNAKQALEEDMTPERVAAINNILLALEKETLNLGSTVTLEDR
ncbi:MAG: MBL fold metallo-hydrolase [Clostridiales bacterium]|nr:MBL fold metallo-hydrolase [Clostridiales bacterium]